MALNRSSSRKGAALLRVLMFVVLLVVGYWWMNRDKKPVAASTAAPAVAPLPVPEKRQEQPPEAPAPLFKHSGSKGVSIREQEEAGKAEYQIFSEGFVRFNSYQGGRELKTAAGVYRAGQMSGKGFVLAVDERQAKIATPSGGIAWVVAEEGQGTPGRAPAVDPAPAAPAAPPPPSSTPADRRGWAPPPEKSTGETT